LLEQAKMRFLVHFGSSVAAIILGGAMCAPAATLEQLSTERMIAESTEIVRGKVSYCLATYRPPVVWTTCEVVVTERLKGAPAARVMVAVPGGTSASLGIRQAYAGAPTLERDKDYLFFLWQGKSGLKQIMGLSQGLMSIVKDEKGNLIAFRGKAEERLLDASGREVMDSEFRMRLVEMRSRVAGAAK
jgi:hypothetical protein